MTAAPASARRSSRVPGQTSFPLAVVLGLAACFAAGAGAVAQSPDFGVLDQIKTEAFDNSKVMDHLHYLTDVYGPRLTASPEFDQAAQWTMDRLKGYGLSNVHLEHWGPFGRSWSVKRYSVEMLQPRYAVLTAAPLAWSSATKGPVTGDALLAPLTLSFARGLEANKGALRAFEEKWAGKLRGRVVLLGAPRTPADQAKPQFRRYSDAELSELSAAPDPHARQAVKNLEELKWPENPDDLARFYSGLPPATIDELFDRYQEIVAERGAFLSKEGAAAVVVNDTRSHEGMVFAEAAGSRKSAGVAAPPTFVVTAEQYDRLARIVEKGEAARLRVELETTASPNDVEGSNIVGEIPGGAKRNEVVMIGAHFDSWHSGTGATDNGAGSAVMIEVMRILQAVRPRLDRTVRIALWGGEEQGLLGSRAYVAAHFGDRKTMHLGAEHAGLAGYFNLDNGSGRIRGVYLQGNDAMRPLFQEWLAPFRDLGVTTITLRNTGGTDHLSFDALGLPGFQFIQDPLDYSTITHHSDMDTYDHVSEPDLMQAAAVIAWVVCQAADRPELLPRRTLPKVE